MRLIKLFGKNKKHKLIVGFFLKEIDSKKEKLPEGSIPFGKINLNFLLNQSWH